MSDTTYAPGMICVIAPPLSPAEIESERLARLRPRDSTSYAAREALASIRAEAIVVAAALAKAQQDAADILVSGQHHHIIAAREVAERAQIIIEQVAAIKKVTLDLVSRREAAEAVAREQIDERLADAEAAAALSGGSLRSVIIN